MSNEPIKIELQGVEELKRRIGAMIAAGENVRPLLEEIAEIMYAEVAANFAAHGRNPHWPDLSPSTKKRYAKKGYSLEPTLDRSSAGLFPSIQTFVTAGSAGLSTNKPYAAIHNAGGDINMPSRSGTARLRTDAKGNLLRQGADGLEANLAVFARGSHKRAKEVPFTMAGYTIHIPQREYFKVGPEGLPKIESAAARFIMGR